MKAITVIALTFGFLSAKDGGNPLCEPLLIHPVQSLIESYRNTGGELMWRRSKGKRDYKTRLLLDTLRAQGDALRRMQEAPEAAEFREEIGKALADYFFVEAL